MSTTWDQHIRTLQALIDAQVPKTQRTATIFPQATTAPQQQPDPTQPWANESLGFDGFSGVSDSHPGPVQGFAAPNVMALSQTAGINPLAGRALATGVGMINPAVGMGLGAANLVGNAINTQANVGMLNSLGVNPSGLSYAGGLLGFNPLAGTYTGALNYGMADRLPGWQGLEVPQAPGDVTGTGYAGGFADTATAMDKALADANTAGTGFAGGKYEGAAINTAPLADVLSEPLAGFASGGYTGAGADGVVQPWMPAGIVHEGEMVVPAWAVRAGLSPQQWAQFANAPIGTSQMPGQQMSNPDPSFSPITAGDPYSTAGARMMGKGGLLTAADLAAGQQAADVVTNQALGFAGQITPIRAFHGSPHTFDRFSMDKIGTGEGAQSYGHGLYFAGNERVARSYRESLAPGKWVMADTGRGSGLTDPFANIAQRAQKSGLDIRRANSIADDIMNAMKQGDDLDHMAKFVRQSDWDPAIKAGWDAALTEAKRFRWEQSPGSMYEVNLRTSPDRLLDWDKPLSEQPQAVRDALKQVKKNLHPEVKAELRGEMSRVFGPNSRGYDVLHDLNNTAANVPQNYAETTLRNAGIDGIRYLDQGSRAAGEGTHNYVMFRDDIIDILRRYGLFGLIGGGAAAGAGGQSQ